jgi:integral membrane protein (TIGR01906 family)
MKKTRNEKRDDDFLTALKYILGVICSICLIGVCLFYAVALPTFTPGFYAYEYTKNEVDKPAPEVQRQAYGLIVNYRIQKFFINIERDELMKVTQHLIDYMSGKNDDMQIEAVVAGRTRPFFSQREIDHMVDVKDLFNGGFFMRNTAFAIIMATVLGLVALKANFWLIIAKSCRVAVVSFVGLLVVLAGLMALNFQRAFLIFHQIFFSNDLWVLSGYDDLLVDMVPQPFFIDIAITIGVLFLFMLVALFIVSNIIVKKIGDNNAYISLDD